ncbi:oxidoreductase [Streptomyces sp. NPDC088354]|uniref:oxidoreductase n=1 Tax=Streptomyces sp. NPDC088354 TaxID=3365856 RepID=UPI0037F8D989
MAWTANDIPDLSGRTAVVTGANSGIGFCTARELARAGARVLLACRSEERGKDAVRRILRDVPAARAGYRHLDLGDLSTVRAFAKEYDADRLDLLVNNAGVMALPHRTTPDGFESQMGVNHLGHFALTGLLMRHLLDTPGARVVTVSSWLHAIADVDLGDLNSDRGYRRWIAYARSKSANLLFVHELARRLAAVGADTVAAAAHPGYARTELQTRGARMENRRVAERLIGIANRVVGQSAEAGALPLLYAATAPGVRPDSFTGPRLQGWRGSPAPSWRAKWTLDDRAGEMLWAASEQLTGVTYPMVVPPAG